MNGSCLCGKIKFEIDGLLQNIANCHCSMCRKFHGAAFGTYGVAVSLNWISGEELIKVYKSSEKAVRGFCSNCGSSIYYKSAIVNSPFEIALGVLDQEPNYPVNADIYCSSRAKEALNKQPFQSHTLDWRKTAAIPANSSFFCPNHRVFSISGRIYPCASSRCLD